jgi:hypothetical protein
MTILAKRTESRQIQPTYPPTLDMPLTTLWTQGTKSTFIPRTKTYPLEGIDMSIETFLDVLTVSVVVEEET